MSNTYKSAGVDKEEGYKTVDKIKSAVAETHNKNVLNNLGSFGAFYEIAGYKNPVLVSGTDGVGTKLKVALDSKKYDSIGIDCFAMCANDILCHGAKPLFFLDYLACGKLDSDIAAEIVLGMVNACKDNNCALIGGETAEMPGMYQPGDYDVAGFCVGIVEKDQIIDGSKIRKGNKIIAIPSSGFHSNGFSLVRKIFQILKKNSKGNLYMRHCLFLQDCIIKTFIKYWKKFQFTVLHTLQVADCMRTFRELFQRFMCKY
jgi:phosphoribosylformylglycinamidine cyclo-ligase